MTPDDEISERPKEEVERMKRGAPPRLEELPIVVERLDERTGKDWSDDASLNDAN